MVALPQPDPRRIEDPLSEHVIGPMAIRTIPDVTAPLERPSKVTVTIDYASGTTQVIEIDGPVEAGFGFDVDYRHGGGDRHMLTVAAESHLDLRFRRMRDCRVTTIERT